MNSTAAPPRLCVSTAALSDGAACWCKGHDISKSSRRHFQELIAHQRRIKHKRADGHFLFGDVRQHFQSGVNNITIGPVTITKPLRYKILEQHGQRS